LTTNEFTITTVPDIGSADDYSWNATSVAFGASAIVSWTLTYGGSTDATYSVAVSAALLSSAYPTPFCVRLSPEFGFYAQSSWALYLIGSPPIAVRASAYWFGSVNSLSHSLLSQVSESSLLGVLAGGSVSWHSRRISPGGRDVVSLFVRWYAGSAHAPLVLLTGFPSSARVSDTLAIDCRLYSEDSDGMAVLAVLDDDSSTTVRANSDALPSGAHTISVPLSSFQIGPGTHILSLYTLSEYGTFAVYNPQISFTVTNTNGPFTLTLLPPGGPTPTPPVTQTGEVVPTTRSPSRSARTATPTATRSPEGPDDMSAGGVVAAVMGVLIIGLCTACFARCGYRAGVPKPRIPPCGLGQDVSSVQEPAGSFQESVPPDVPAPYGAAPPGYGSQYLPQGGPAPYGAAPPGYGPQYVPPPGARAYDASYTSVPV
jgi:hypothetical protein